MTTLPPDDPNRNNSGRNLHVKDIPHDGQRRRRQQQREGETMDIFGDMQDSPAVVALFLIGLASWLLRERCIC